MLLVTDAARARLQTLVDETENANTLKKRTHFFLQMHNRFFTCKRNLCLVFVKSLSCAIKREKKRCNHNHHDIAAPACLRTILKLIKLMK